MRTPCACLERLGCLRDPLRGALLFAEFLVCVVLPMMLWAQMRADGYGADGTRALVLGGLLGLAVCAALVCLGVDLLAREPPRSRFARGVLALALGGGLVAVGLMTLTFLPLIALTLFPITHGVRRLEWLGCCDARWRWPWPPRDDDAAAR